MLENAELQKESNKNSTSPKPSFVAWVMYAFHLANMYGKKVSRIKSSTEAINELFSSKNYAGYLKINNKFAYEFNGVPLEFDKYVDGIEVVLE